MLVRERLRGVGDGESEDHPLLDVMAAYVLTRSEFVIAEFQVEGVVSGGSSHISDLYFNVVERECMRAAGMLVHEWLRGVGDGESEDRPLLDVMAAYVLMRSEFVIAIKMSERTT
ncbi:hypothetical protein NDU88_004186 [Pleurodeles waltl]|uniref:Uncharacterized protein n=1 Tax=Pleurodeles waltl TaxID=8319 RepID=A0AAV7NJ39_PLEWA|nr:hypothetical protein NDU88_004186 [Pleurodeles waltl]